MGCEALGVPYKLLAAAFHPDSPQPQHFYDWLSTYHPIIGQEWAGKVVSKERPRTSANGHMYTPQKTRKFEAEIAEWAAMHYKGRPPFYPVAVRLHIYDKSDDELLLMGVTSKQHGDIDNKAKAILDACNGILWRDDKQINSLTIERGYQQDFEGFNLRVRRNGLSKNEVENLRKYIRNL